jgi:hypothetical protein
MGADKAQTFGLRNPPCRIGKDSIMAEKLLANDATTQQHHSNFSKR